GHRTRQHVNTSHGGHQTDLATRPTPTGQTATATTPSSPGAGVRWTALFGALGCLVVLGALVPLPRLIRRSRRARRLAGGAEDAWAELRDTAVDLGVSWPTGRSPRETGACVSASFGAEPDGPPPVRPARGSGLAPDAERALDRIVLALEH